MERRKHADLIIAWANGATVEFLHRGKWELVNIPTWADGLEYRVKPEPKLVPFSLDDADKIIGKPVKKKNGAFGCAYLITAALLDNVKLSMSLYNGDVSYQSLLEDFVFLNGNPCGKLETP